jgi:putative Ca2+/H+ antiporter (TMEM165/GDT1 family)
MEAFLVSAGVVALGEIGDKTQLLALMLAARFRRPMPIILGILAATLANHALAGFLGNLVRTFVPTEVLRWLVALSFFGVALWALKPDKLDADVPPPATRWGVFGVTVAAFFIAEMGDKTQVATVILAAKFASLAAVVFGTTLGMLVANVPVVLIGNAASAKIPFKAVRIAAALLFAALGVYALFASAPAAAATTNTAATGERANLFDDPFLQVTDGIAACPPQHGPMITQAEMRAEAHPRAERGTRCYQSGRCHLPNSYLYDKEIIPRVKTAILVDGRFAGTSVWALGQRRWVILKGCVRTETERKALESLVRAIDDVEAVVNELVVTNRKRAPAP